MKKNQVRRVIVHQKREAAEAFAEKASAFHVEVIERRLDRSGFTAAEKIAVIDKILENIKSQKDHGARE